MVDMDTIIAGSSAVRVKSSGGGIDGGVRMKKAPPDVPSGGGGGVVNVTGKADKFIIGGKEYNLKDVYDELKNLFDAGLSDDYIRLTDFRNAVDKAIHDFNKEHNIT